MECPAFLKIAFMIENNWYTLDDPGQTDSPALLIYPWRIRQNIGEMIRIAGSPQRLMPHIKTHKMSAVVKMQLEAGIRRFKCATIAEAEMLAATGAKEVLLAYQLSAPKALRFMKLIREYPEVDFSSLVDNTGSVAMLNDLFAGDGTTASVFIDVDNGMHRTGFPAGDTLADFYKKVAAFPFIHCRGLHVYDGHIREKDFKKRRAATEAAFAPVTRAVKAIREAGLPRPEVIAGGSPTFPVHALNPEVICSPGTSLLWDKGYGDLLAEQPFLQAAVLLTRVLSKPQDGNLTTDLGHKSVAAENPIDQRVFFLNMENYEVISQSEEHLGLKIDQALWKEIKVGDVLYGIPYHICPTVALYDEVEVVENGHVTGQWKVEARTKKISV
jgi:D-serine deaminase-like pyridoxal phosphate-dependent protein